MRNHAAFNDVVSAAIWAKLPEDATAVALVDGEAAAAADWHTCNTIEALPVVHPGRLTTGTLDGLRRDRGAVEAPESAKALETAEHTLEVVEGVNPALTRNTYLFITY